ncbi:unnamed protein product [Didymodactylos carnosus]|uniref:Uncharacterized protein n=1 Tax=Didymodactylos carnosus TaxID=1234261 RepID=A0A814K7M6_9BILA|nr:unnamed protein product [Didymodactylos carnosus]CAF1379130.1 unnamed protein product [Didymodactylos carnosus]CAF3815562.1 unnamed protein product [Didymodactylos carnosus]CAF4187756.1 unnamed protein product [Didymodactylos carnosus]
MYCACKIYLITNLVYVCIALDAPFDNVNTSITAGALICIFGIVAILIVGGIIWYFLKYYKKRPASSVIVSKDKQSQDFYTERF